MTLAARLFTEAEARAERQRAEYEASQEAILRRYERHPALRPDIWADVLDDGWRVVWAAWAVLVVVSLAQWVAM